MDSDDNDDEDDYVDCRVVLLVVIASPLEGSALSGSAQGWRKMCDWRQVKHSEVEREGERRGVNEL